MTETESIEWSRAVAKRNPDFAFRKIEDEGILIPIRTNPIQDPRLYALNPTGVRIWELIDGIRTGEEICKILCEEFETDIPTLSKDLNQFMEFLVSVGGIQSEAKK